MNIQIEAIHIAMKLNPEINDFQELVPKVNEIVDFLLEPYPAEEENALQEKAA